MFSKIFFFWEKVEVPWTNLTSVDQLEEVDKKSREKPVLLFKHSIRCSISAMSLARFERSYEEEASFKPYFLDLSSHRDVSNAIAERYGVRHESPQAIPIKDGKAVFNSSHMGISYSELNDFVH